MWAAQTHPPGPGRGREWPSSRRSGDGPSPEGPAGGPANAHEVRGESSRDLRAGFTWVSLADLEISLQKFTWGSRECSPSGRTATITRKPSRSKKVGLHGRTNTQEKDGRTASPPPTDAGHAPAKTTPHRVTTRLHAQTQTGWKPSVLGKRSQRCRPHSVSRLRFYAPIQRGHKARWINLPAAILRSSQEPTSQARWLPL
jgi:hypothetical protein